MKYENKYVIGITGGVGTGKSFISGYICGRFNAELISADEIAKESYEPGSETFNKLIEAFGEDIKGRDGAIDRSVLAHLVFGDKEQLKKLNSIVHPVVVQRAKEKVAASEGLLIYEAALPKEASMQDICDEIWYVYSSDEVRIKRLIDNRGYTKSRSEKLIASQPSDSKYRSVSNTVIDNNGDVFSAVSNADKAMTAVLVKAGLTLL